MKYLSSPIRKWLATGTAIAVALSTPAFAADKPVPVKPLKVEDVPAMMPADAYGPTPKSDPMNPFAGMENFALKKPIVDLPKPDPAKMVIAEKVANALYPDGTSPRIFTALRTELLMPVVNRFWTMKESEAADLFGMPMPPREDFDEAGNPIPAKDETLGEAMGKDDPHAKERIEGYAKVYLDLLGEMMAPLDPDLRGAMARDFARRYSTAQLTEMATFFATPTGQAFGRDYWLSSFSLDLIQTSLMNWPKAMKAVPDFAERIKKADAHLPPAPPGSPFGKPDLSYLPTCAQDGDESDCTDADWDAWDNAQTGDAAAAAADAVAAAATDYDPDAYAAEQKKLRAAWSKADLKAVEKAEANYEKLAKQHDALDAEMMKAETITYEATTKAKRNAGQPVDDDEHHHD